MIIRRSECTGCFACKQACPVQAIEVALDENGFMVPLVKQNCISCNICEKVCPIDKPLMQRKQNVFSFINGNSESLTRSSSGGFFIAVADYIIEQGGVIFGCVLDEKKHAIHASATTQNSVKKMQGSKYVQSYIGNTYIEASRFLTQGKMVLFTGTPCQIHGLYSYLGKDFKNLITIDIVCHGVPNQKMLDHELEWIEEREKSEVQDLLFRDKKINGWSLIGSLRIRGKKKVFSPCNSPYYYFFDKGCTYRESCYSCKYANLNRTGDITIGDFWGIERNRIEKPFIVAKGVSLVISNSEKGLGIIKQVEEKGMLISNDIRTAIDENVQLIKPVSMSKRDLEVIEMYYRNDMSGLRKKHISEMGIRRFTKTIKAFLPVSIKLRIKGLINCTK